LNCESEFSLRLFLLERISVTDLATEGFSATLSADLKFSLSIFY
jgi:hypothetical protein